jgi:hypothetical protein
MFNWDFPASYRSIKQAMIGTFLLCIAPPLIAQPSHEQSAAEIAKLRIFVKDTGLEINFQTPLFYLLDDELPTETEDQDNVLKKLGNRLQQTAILFATSPAAHCQADSININLPIWINGQDSSESSETAQNPDQNRGYQGVLARFDLNCRQAAELNSLDINLFKLFPKLNVLHVELSTVNDQRNLEITAENNHLYW